MPHTARGLAPLVCDEAEANEGQEAEQNAKGQVENDDYAVTLVLDEGEDVRRNHQQREQKHDHLHLVAAGTRSVDESTHPDTDSIVVRVLVGVVHCEHALSLE